MGTKVNSMASRVKGLICLWHHEHGRTYRSHDFSGGGRSRVLVSWRSTRDATSRRRVPWLATPCYLLSFPILTYLTIWHALTISAIRVLVYSQVFYYIYARCVRIDYLSGSFYCKKRYIVYILADLGALRAPLPARTPDRWSRTNPNFAQTQTSHKPKLRTNPNFAQTQTSHKPKLHTNPNFEQTQSSNKSKLRTNPNFE